VDFTHAVHALAHALLVYDHATQQTQRFPFVFVLYAVDAAHLDVHAAHV